MKLLFLTWLDGILGISLISRTWCNMLSRSWRLIHLWCLNTKRQQHLEVTTKIKHFWIKLRNPGDNHNFLIPLSCQVVEIIWIKCNLKISSCNNQVHRKCNWAAKVLSQHRWLKPKITLIFKDPTRLLFKAQLWLSQPRPLKMINSSNSCSLSWICTPLI